MLWFRGGCKGLPSRLGGYFGAQSQNEPRSPRAWRGSRTSLAVLVGLQTSHKQLLGLSQTTMSISRPRPSEIAEKAMRPYAIDNSQTSELQRTTVARRIAVVSAVDCAKPYAWRLQDWARGFPCIGMGPAKPFQVGDRQAQPSDLGGQGELLKR